MRKTLVHIHNRVRKSIGTFRKFKGAVNFKRSKIPRGGKSISNQTITWYMKTSTRGSRFIWIYIFDFKVVLYSLAVVGLAVHLPLPDEAGLLAIQGAHAHAAAEAVGVPGAAADLQEEPIRDGFPARCAGTQLSLEESGNIKWKSWSSLVCGTSFLCKILVILFIITQTWEPDQV